jgi:hypothetical protein
MVVVLSFSIANIQTRKDVLSYLLISRPIRRIMIFSLEILEKIKNNGEYILMLVIY